MKKTKHKEVHEFIYEKAKIKAKTEIFISSGPPSIGAIEKLFAIYFDNLEPKAAPRVPPKEINPKYCFALSSRNKFIATTQNIATTKKL